MMTLTDLFDVMWDITALHITARDHEGKFLHGWIYADGISERETTHMYHDRIDGKLILVDVKINMHGTVKKNGQTEIGWGVNDKLIHKVLITAPVRHLNVINYSSDELEVYADVELSRQKTEELIAIENEDDCEQMELDLTEEQHEGSNNQEHADA